MELAKRTPTMDNYISSLQQYHYQIMLIKKKGSKDDKDVVMLVYYYSKVKSSLFEKIFKRKAKGSLRKKTLLNFYNVSLPQDNEKVEEILVQLLAQTLLLDIFKKSL